MPTETRRVLRNFTLTEDELSAVIRQALTVSNNETTDEVTATFQRRGIHHVAIQICSALDRVDQTFSISEFMGECGFYA